MKRGLQETLDLIRDALTGLKVELGVNSPLIRTAALEVGLHRASLSAALSEWAETMTTASLSALARSTSKPRGGHVTTLAPGNIPIVAAETIILGLLAGITHDLALSRRSEALPRRLFEILSALDPSVSETTRLHVWRKLPAEARRSLLAADRVVVYGTADTVEWVASRAPRDTVIVPHGPSIALAYLRPQQATGGCLTSSLRRLALDIVLFDQRGCRSPHALLVAGNNAMLQTVIQSLGTELEVLSKSFPRGALSAEETTALYLDKLTSSSLGSVTEGSGWRITLETQPKIIRPSPLGRTIRVLGIQSGDSLSPYFVTLPAPVNLLLTPTGSAPDTDIGDFEGEIAAFGAAQRPAFDRLHDGRHRLDELLGRPGG